MCCSERDLAPLIRKGSLLPLEDLAAFSVCSLMTKDRNRMFGQVGNFIAI